jgi:tetratricopeptide (TPR) repeat protein
MEESAWLLEKTAAWTKLYDVLRNTGKFRQLWKNNPSEVKTYWEKIESNTKKRRITAYEQVTKQIQRIPKDTLFSLATFFFETGYSHEAETILLYLSTIRATQKNREIQQYSFGLLGNLYYTAGRYREAKNCYKKKMFFCQKAGNTLELARVVGNLGVMENIVQNYEEALNYYEKAGTICRQLGFLHGIQTELGNRGNIYVKMKNLDKALEVFKEQEQICRESGLVPGLIATLSNLTAIMAAKKEFEKTLALFDEQEMLCKKIGDLNQLQVVYGNRAVALYGLGKKQEAVEWLNNKWSLCLKINNFDGQQMALSNLSVYYMDENDLDKAFEYCCQRVDLCREHKARIPLAQSLYQYAHILGKYGRHDEAGSVLQQIEMLI